MCLTLKRIMKWPSAHKNLLPRNKNQRKSLSMPGTLRITKGPFRRGEAGGRRTKKKKKKATSRHGWNMASRVAELKMKSACEKDILAPLMPASRQGQESPFNLNTYHHDNNLVTLSEANLFISLTLLHSSISLFYSPISGSICPSLLL